MKFVAVEFKSLHRLTFHHYQEGVSFAVVLPLFFLIFWCRLIHCPPLRVNPRVKFPEYIEKLLRFSPWASHPEVELGEAWLRSIRSIPSSKGSEAFPVESGADVPDPVPSRFVETGYVDPASFPVGWLRSKWVTIRLTKFLVKS